MIPQEDESVKNNLQFSEIHPQNATRVGLGAINCRIFRFPCPGPLSVDKTGYPCKISGSTSSRWQGHSSFETTVTHALLGLHNLGLDPRLLSQPDGYGLEILTLRQQVAVLKRKRPRPTLRPLDRLFWTILRHCWSRWSDVLVIVKPETVVDWHRAGFRLYWRWRSRCRGGRPRINEETRNLIKRIADENPSWGAPRIHGEIQKLGIVISERTAARYLRRLHRRHDPAKRWLTFFRNHREAIVAFDFFTVPTVTFRLLYRFFVVEHGRRRILHLMSPVIQQPIGSFNSYVRHYLKRPPIDMHFLIMTPSSTATC